MVNKRGMGFVIAAVGVSLTLASCSGTVRATVSTPSAPVASSATPTSDAPAVTPEPTPTDTTETPADTTTPTPDATGSQTAPPASSTTTSGSVTRARSGVVRIEVLSCDGFIQGSGFLYGDGSTVVTAAHVVKGVVDIRVIRGTTSYHASVRDIDTASDIALLKLDSSAGTALPVASADPQQGQRLSALGYTLGEAYAAKAGTVTALNQAISVESGMMSGLVELDAAVNQGNSGGPVVTKSGAIAGMVVAGATSSGGGRFAVPASQLRSTVDAWLGKAPQNVPPNLSCYVARNFDAAPLTPRPAAYVAVAEAAHTLSIYLRTINTADVASAVAQYAAGGDTEELARATRSTKITSQQIVQWRFANDAPILRVRYSTTQNRGDGPQGRPSETCTVWNKEFTFVNARQQWLIDTDAAPAGVPESAPC